MNPFKIFVFGVAALFTFAFRQTLSGGRRLPTKGRYDKHRRGAATEVKSASEKYLSRSRHAEIFVSFVGVAKASKTG